jgi:1L-myo-inositol 1-phosphate cytidylyltransferase
MMRPQGSTLSQGRLLEAVILMAGAGSRLRGSDQVFLKPLVSVAGRPLVSHTIEALVNAGIKKINAVIGFEGKRLSAAVTKLVPSGIETRFIENSDWERKNGVSLLAAAKCVDGPFLLTMSDHLFDAAIIDRLIGSANFSELNVAVDRKLDRVFDLADAMKMQTRGDRVVAIDKALKKYDAIDTGLFICPPGIFDYLERVKMNGDCSLADGVRAMALDGKVRAIDIGDAWWQDVDTPEMLREAEEKLWMLARN